MIYATLATGAVFLRRYRTLIVLLAVLLAIASIAAGHAPASAPLLALGLGQMMYPDPINPAVDVNDYLRLQTQRVGSATVTWASGADTAPSVARSRFALPKVGILNRLFVDIDGGSATAFDLTIGAGASAVAANGQGPFGIIEGFSLRVNGSSGWYDVSGFGTYLVNAAENASAFPQDAIGTIYTTAPTDIASTLFTYPVVDGRPRFGFEIPVTVSATNPLGMLLLQNDQTTVELEIRWASLSNYAALTAGAVATLTLTASIVMEYFDVPPRDAFVAFFLPLLRWGHWWVEERQDIVATGRDANIVSLDNHDTYLRIIHTLLLNGATTTDAIEALRFILNRQTYLYDHDDATHLRRQRTATGGKDLPAFIWDFFSAGTLRDAIHADAYTDIRSVIDVTSGSTLGTSPYIRSANEKLVDLGDPMAGNAGVPANTVQPRA
jgi:hypothetical protein